MAEPATRGVNGGRFSALADALRVGISGLEAGLVSLEFPLLDTPPFCEPRIMALLSRDCSGVRLGG